MASAQTCKPDMSKEDKITKERIDVWTHVLFSTGFASNLLSSSTGNITATVGRYGTLNAINLQIEKRERSATNAVLESARRGAVGQSFYLGFKDGEPLGLTVSSVNNQAVRGKGLSDDQIITTVVLSATLDDERMATLRSALTSKAIDAVRMSLAGDLKVEESVSAKNGEGMRAQFACFYQSLEKRGISLSADASRQSQLGQSTPVLSAGGLPPRDYTGRYVFKKGNGTDSDYIDLGPDGKFVGQQGRNGFAGSFTVQGDLGTFVLTDGRGQKCRFIGNTIVQADGTVFEKQTDAVKASAGALTIDQIIQMVMAKIPDDIIVASIEKSGSRFDLTPENLIKLKTSGTSDAVLRAMAK
jgi:hypothetical protein